MRILEQKRRLGRSLVLGLAAGASLIRTAYELLVLAGYGVRTCSARNTGWS